MLNDRLLKQVARIVVVFLLFHAACDAHAQEKKKPSHEIDLAGQKASIDIPKHDLVTVTHRKERAFLFYSIKAGYKQNHKQRGYANIPGEMSMRLFNGTLEDAYARWKKIHLDNGRYQFKKSKGEGYAVWLLADPGESIIERRAFLFVPTGDQVFVVDASSQSVADMPRRNMDLINKLLKQGLSNIKLNGEAVDLKRVIDHIGLKTVR